jgi:phage protein D
MHKNGAAGKLQRSTNSKQIDRNKAEQAMPFVKGKSGNPRGRPVGARGKKTLAREAALRAEAEAKIGRLVWPKGRARTRRATCVPMLDRGRPVSSAAGDIEDLRAVAAFLGPDWLTLMEAAGLVGDRGAEAEADDLL